MDVEQIFQILYLPAESFQRSDEQFLFCTDVETILSPGCVFNPKWGFFTAHRSHGYHCLFDTRFRLLACTASETHG